MSFSAQYPKRYCRSSRCGPFEIEHPETVPTAFLIPKGTMQRARLFVKRASTPGPKHANLYKEMYGRENVSSWHIFDRYFICIHLGSMRTQTYFRLPFVSAACNKNRENRMLSQANVWAALIIFMHEFSTDSYDTSYVYLFICRDKSSGDALF